jgi:hypothetical protein
MSKRLTEGAIVEVRIHNSRMAYLDDLSGWTTEKVRVVEPNYIAPFGRCFTGEMLTGRHVGKVLSLQIENVWGLEVER